MNLKKLKQDLKGLIALDNPFRLLYHKVRAICANIMYGFPSRDMVIIWVTGTNGKTTTSNIIAKWLRQAGIKTFMFSTVNIIIDQEEYTNDTKMTSPDAFELQRLLKVAKQRGCTHAVIETASHGIKMHRNWGINYDIAVLTNITQDHLDLHKTMNDYVNTKLKLFQNLILSRRKNNIKKTAIINAESEYKERFLGETYDNLHIYGNWEKSDLVAKNITADIDGMKFDVTYPGQTIRVETVLRWDFNVYNILAAIGVYISLGIKPDQINDMVKVVTGVPGRMEEVPNAEWFKVFIDYAHTPDALEQVLKNLRAIKWINRIITVFGATWDRDTTKRPIMWEIVSKLSDVVVLTQDDDYTENTEKIIKDVIPGIERKEWEDFWIIPDRKEAIRNALIVAEKNDLVLVAWKWDEHVMVTNDGLIDWHDKAVVNEILSWLDANKIIK